MLQQTQVQTVLTYYSGWLRRFPSVHTLACADLDQVMKAWQGLGYYQRAKNLHRAAQQIVGEHGGIFPRNIEQIRRLPGIGDYTAGAVASIAFDLPVCALDVNVLRVGARLLGLKRRQADKFVVRRVRQKVLEWMPAGRARWFNQALMELGALVCFAAKPHCDACPLRPYCAANRRGIQDDIPQKPRAKQKTRLNVVAGVAQDDCGKVLIQKRPAHGLMANLWEFPGGKVMPGEARGDALIREWKEELGVAVQPQRKIMTIRHSYTQFDVQLHVFLCRITRGIPRALWAEQIRWVRTGELDRFAYPSANLKIVRWLTAGGSQEKN